MQHKTLVKTGFIGLAISITLSGCALFPQKKPQQKQPITYKPPTENRTIQEELAAQDKIIKFNNYDELKGFLEENELSSDYYGYGMMGGVTRGLEVQEEFVATAAPMADDFGMALDSIQLKSGVSDGGSEDFSTTNVQVEGVDEADIIKTDGDYVYALVKNDLYIIDGYPAENAEILTKIAFKSRPQNIYINDNRLVIYGADNQFYDIETAPIFRRRSQHTFLKVFDITDKKKPELMRDLNFEGNYTNSRMIGDYVYFVTTNYNHYYYPGDPVVPYITENDLAISGMCAQDTKCFNPEVYYFDIPYNSYNFTSVTSINVQDENEMIQGDVYILDYAQNMYVSLENMYITYTKYISEYKLAMEVMRDILFPRLSASEQGKISAIEATENFILNREEKMMKISMILERYMSGLQDSEQIALEKELENAMKKKYEDLSKELEKTIIHKVAIDKGNFEYQTYGEVTGNVLNQFSMDERDGYFRIATTKNRTWSQFEEESRDSYSNLYVLDGNLQVVGKVENLAEGERIYSVRFMQDRAYMVTFRQTDPLFVIDLKNPKNPRVLGKLKIPGFSNYLHPYDDNLLIGIGKDTEESEWGGVTTKGVKLSLFDVSDVTNPVEKDTYILGDKGSDSIALHDHKAFLFSKEKNLLAIPVSIRESDGSRWGGKLTFVGSAVFTITPDGFELKGKIDHSDGGKPSNSDYWFGYNYYDNTVRRNLYIDDVLYSFSNNYLKMNKLDDLSEVKSLRLKLTGGDDYEVITNNSGRSSSGFFPTSEPMEIFIDEVF